METNDGTVYCISRPSGCSEDEVLVMAVDSENDRRIKEKAIQCTL